MLTFAFLFFQEDDSIQLDSTSIGDFGKVGCVLGFLLFAIVADCASVVRKGEERLISKHKKTHILFKAISIIVEKDWVVVMAAGSKTDLAGQFTYYF
jgi:hypothetical protein